MMNMIKVDAIFTLRKQENCHIPTVNDLLAPVHIQPFRVTLHQTIILYDIEL